MRRLANTLMAVAAAFLLSGLGTVLGAGKEKDFSDCLSCHHGIEKISPNHEFRCARCHVRPGLKGSGPLPSHEEIIRNPSDPALVRFFCMPCHKEEIARVARSLHGSLSGLINQTRYLWGAQESATPAVYGLSAPFKALPVPDEKVYPDKPALLVDDFLRRRCLRCHLHARGSPAEGLYRAEGCAACHMLYGNKGLYKGEDAAIDKSIKGYPLTHEFSTRIPSWQCLHCHNHNHVGTDFQGLFEQDYSNTYRSPVSQGSPERLYGLGYHRLSKDIHAIKGLWCIDCHHGQDIMGNGTIYDFQMEKPKTRCTDCHGGFDDPIPDTSLPGVERTSRGGQEEFSLISPGRGERHVLPLFSKRSAGHHIREHSSLRCSACHAQWSFQDFGLSVMRKDRIGGAEWAKLTAQGDPEIERILKARLGSRETRIFFQDRLSGERRYGIWLKGWRFRRWEPMPLGKDHRGRFTVLRPLYQFFISYTDRLGNTPLDSVVPMRGDGSAAGWSFMPYVPHTIAPEGRACDACHGNSVAAGLGFPGELTPDTRLSVPSPPAVKSMGLLSPLEQKRLMNPSRRWARERLRIMTEEPDP